MKVWIVTSGSYYYRIQGVFSTKENAQRFAALLAGENPGIEEYVMDARAKDVIGPTWKVWMKYASGDLDAAPVIQPDRPRNPRYTEVSKGLWDEVLIVAQSAVSPEHAVKIAAEYRQALLREELK